MTGQPDTAAARAYLAQLRGGGPPLVPPDEDVCAFDGAQVEDAAPALASAGEFAQAAQPLELVAVNDALELRDRTGSCIFGQLKDVRGFDVSAYTADEVCRFAFESTRRGWMIAARSDHDGSTVAAFRRGWRPGGEVWVAPEHWCTLRWTPFARGLTWRLATADHEILRVRTLAQDRLEIVTGHVVARPMLLVLLVSWVILTETSPAEAVVPRS